MVIKVQQNVKITSVDLRNTLSDTIPMLKSKQLLYCNVRILAILCVISCKGDGGACRYTVYFVMNSKGVRAGTVCFVTLRSQTRPGAELASELVNYKGLYQPSHLQRFISGLKETFIRYM